MTNDLTLSRRDGLPETLRVLLDRYPREGWEQHREFGALTRFWLDRHVAFRRLVAALREDAERALDRHLDAQALQSRLGRLGNMLLQELHGHHSIEDQIYFPKLVAVAPGLERGFVLLDADHHQLHDELAQFAERANAVLQTGGADAIGAHREGLQQMERFLDRHLTDEEDLVVPIILDVGEGRLG